MDSISVFFPTFNEEGSIKETVENAKKVLEKVAKNWEIIIVNDGSTDKTGEIATKLANGDKRIRVISHKENKGYGASLKSGFYNAKYPWIAFTDSDGQFDFSEIAKFIEKQKLTRSDLVIGYYKKRRVSKFKIITSRMWELAVMVLFSLHARDIDCGFKLVSKKVIDKIPKLESERGAFISSELLIKAKKAGFKIVEIPVTHYPRIKGKGTGRNIRVIIKSFVDLFRLWIKLNWVLVLILLIGAFLRLYNISGYMTFLGDEGRDAIVVRNLVVNFDPILIGPGTSIGNMYLGPLYYYFMAPFLLAFGLSPVGPAVGVALLGVITIFLIYKATKEWFGDIAAIFSSILYAIAPTVIIYSRSSWNPNIMPFFALLAVYSIWKVWKSPPEGEVKQYNWLLVTAVSFAFVLQSHYLGLLLTPVLFIFWLISKVPIKYTLIAGAVFLFLMSPLLLFDIRHDWMNTKAFHKFLTVRQETVSIKPWNAFPKTYPIFEQINTSLLTANNIIVGKFVSIGLVFSLSTLLIYINRVKKKKPLLILLTWLGFALLGLALYKQHIYDHYFGFIFPVLFILLGFILQFIFKSKYKIVVILIFLCLVFVNIIKNPLRYHPNYQLQRSINVANKIIAESGGDNFNIAVVAERNYEDGYQYFLEKENSKIIEIDPQIPESVANQLFVICEMGDSNPPNGEVKCDPTHSAKAEVANFGWSKIENSWKVDGVIIYKLIHTK